MANTQQTPPETNPNPGGAGASGAPSDEQRIAAQRLKDLERQASEAVSASQEAKRGEAAARGDLERANLENVALRAQVERLTAENKALAETTASRDTLPTLPVDLPKGAFQLTESVTLAALGDDGKPVRANAKRGDVVLSAGKKADAEELQEDVGLAARVYPVSKQTLDELRDLKHIR
jgi:hypothetical protein